LRQEPLRFACCEWFTVGYTIKQGPLGSCGKGVRRVVRKSEVTTLSIYIPKSKLERRPIERLDRLAKKLDRSINYLVVEAIVQYLDREEKRK
jgi:hypothetical protein